MPSQRAGPPVARYLRPEEKVVPFRARPELDELRRWCASRDHVAVRLVTGDGGTGKTRLALQFIEELAARGWQQLWVRGGLERDAVRAAHTLGQPSVLVMDYAETRRELPGLLDEVAADQDGPDLRMILLARSAGEWWEELQYSAEEQAAELLTAYPPITLGPVRAAGGRGEVFGDALTAFARKLGVARPDIRLNLTDPEPVILVLHAAALLAVADYAAGADPYDRAVSGPEVLEALLRHEGRYWERSAARGGLDLGVSVLRLAVAVGSLIGAESQIAACELLSCLPELDSAERCGQVARWLHDLYPPAHENDAPQEWLGPLEPDRLAEQLIAGELAKRPELIAPLFTGLDETRGARALTVLARAALTQDRTVSLLGSALAADLDHLAVPALSVAVRTNPVLGKLLSRVIPGQPVSRETLRRVAEKSPRPSLALAAPAAVVLERLAEDSADDIERAGWLTDLSGRLAELGRQEEALAAIEQATGIYRQFLPKAAISLNSQSMRLADLGRRAEALAAIEEAVSIYRPLAEKLPDTHQPNLAAILHTQSYRLAELGQHDEALAAIEEAVSIYQLLAEKFPDTYQPDLAAILNSQSMRLADLGRHDEALTSIEEAVRIGRSLADQSPDAFQPKLADVLHTRSYRLAELGRHDEALAAVEEAISIYRPLAEALPSAFRPDLAISLNSQSIRLAELGRHDEALAAIEDAISIYRPLAEKLPGAFQPRLADILHTQSYRLAELGRHDEALAAIEDAISIYRPLAEALPSAFRPDLAISLNSQSIRLAELGRHDEALAAVEDAISIYRPLAEKLPGAFQPKLADILHTQSYRLAELGRHDEALAAIEDAISAYRPLADARPNAFLPDLAGSLNSQSDRLFDLGRREEALAAIEQATGIYRQIAEPRPAAFLPKLATSLNKLAGVLSMLNRNAEASAIRAELAATSSASAWMSARAPTDGDNTQRSDP